MSDQSMNPEQEQQYPTNFFPADPEYGKSEKPLVGVVGHGFVGKAVERSFLPEVERFLVDPNYGTTIDQLVEQEPILTFVCTPTPVGGNGRVDAAITVDAILKIIRKTKSAVVLKSTVTPDVIDKICRALAPEQAEYRFVYAPEFLTEKNADDEYCNPKYMVLGGVPESCNILIEFFHFNTFMRLPKNTEDDGGIHIVSPTEASFIKYAINCFLATKVAFFNNLYDACKDELYTTNPTIVARTVAAEPRIGATHWRVPGPDGKKGFGGACFPKDMAAFNAYTDKMKIIDSVLKINDEYRSEYELDSREAEQKITFGKRDVSDIKGKEEDAA